MQHQLSLADDNFAPLHTVNVQVKPFDSNVVVYRKNEYERSLYVVEQGWPIAYSFLQNGLRYIYSVCQADDIVGLEDTNLVIKPAP